MLQTGDVYLVDIPFEKTDHYWVMVTGINSSGEIAYAMLTDAKNIGITQTTLPKGTQAWGTFKLTKDTAVDTARANLHDAKTLEQMLQTRGQFQGQTDPQFLDSVRNMLRGSNLTPPQVLKAL